MVLNFKSQVQTSLQSLKDLQKKVVRSVQAQLLMKFRTKIFVILLIYQNELLIIGKN
jgi:hypothetical protein